MKAYLVDPNLETVERVRVIPRLSSVLRVIEAKSIECIYWKDHWVFVDDVRYLGEKEAFALDDYKCPLAGKALITGVDLTDCRLPVRDLEYDVRFVGLDEGREDWLERLVFEGTPWGLPYRASTERMLKKWDRIARHRRMRGEAPL
jgi:hypothetical protein